MTHEVLDLISECQRLTGYDSFLETGMGTGERLQQIIARQKFHVVRGVEYDYEQYKQARLRFREELQKSVWLYYGPSTRLLKHMMAATSKCVILLAPLQQNARRRELDIIFTQVGPSPLPVIIVQASEALDCFALLPPAKYKRLEQSDYVAFLPASQ